MFAIFALKRTLTINQYSEYFITYFYFGLIKQMIDWSLVSS